MEFCIQKTTAKLWEIRATLGAALLFSTFFALAVFFGAYFLIGAAVTAVLYVAALFYIPLFIKNFSLLITKEAITQKNGVIFKTVRIMPETRLVFLQSNTTPLSKWLKLKSISFFAAKARVITPEFDEREAEKIISFIKEVQK